MPPEVRGEGGGVSPPLDREVGQRREGPMKKGIGYAVVLAGLVLMVWFGKWGRTGGQEQEQEGSEHAVCGDLNGSGGKPDISDAVYLLNWLFVGGPNSQCLAACQPPLGDVCDEINALKQEINTLKQRYKWTPTPKTFLGGLPIDPVGTVSYALVPAVIPDQAQEVLLYITIYTGNVPGTSGEIDFRIFTTDGQTEYAHHFYGHGYPQDAVGYNSDTFWLPITSTQKVFITSTGNPLTMNSNGAIYVLGYR